MTSRDTQPTPVDVLRSLQTTQRKLESIPPRSPEETYQALSTGLFAIMANTKFKPLFFPEQTLGQLDTVDGLSTQIATLGTPRVYDTPPTIPNMPEGIDKFEIGSVHVGLHFSQLEGTNPKVVILASGVLSPFTDAKARTSQFLLDQLKQYAPSWQDIVFNLALNAKLDGKLVGGISGPHQFYSFTAEDIAQNPKLLMALQDGVGNILGNIARRNGTNAQLARECSEEYQLLIDRTETNLARYTHEK